MDEIKPIGADTNAHDSIIRAVRVILNQYPDLQENEVIRFEDLQTDYGIAFSSDSGALIMEQAENILGEVMQTCIYPFFVVYRTAANRENLKINIQDFLNKLGTWLAKEPVIINDIKYQLKTYPTLTQDRKITKITRMNAYATTPNENGVQDWLLPVTLEYKYQFERW